MAASLLVRSALPPASVMESVRREVQAIDRDQPVVTIQTLDQMLAQDRWPYRLFGGLFAIFALIALGLSCVGLYAVMAYSVTLRTQEIGVRMTLGAQRREVSWLVLKRGLVQLALGMTLGLAGALALSRVMRSVLVQVTPSDPVTFGTITLLLTLVSIAACLQPARRASRGRSRRRASRRMTAGRRLDIPVTPRRLSTATADCHCRLRLPTVTVETRLPIRHCDCDCSLSTATAD